MVEAFQNLCQTFPYVRQWGLEANNAGRDGKSEGRKEKSHDWNYRDACRKAAINMIKEELDVADMVRVYRIMYGDDKVKKSVFWNLEEAREGPGRRRFREKEVSRTASTQRKDIRNKLGDSIYKEGQNS